MVDMHARSADVIFPQADVAPEFLNVGVNHQAPAQQSVTEQFLYPLTILDIGFTPGDLRGRNDDSKMVPNTLK